MNYIELKCEITPYNEDIAQIIISELGEIGYDSFTENEDSIDAYITEDLFDMDQVKAINLDYLPKSDFKLNYTHKVVISQDWNALWESNFQPVIISDQVVIRASFHTDTPKVPYDIVIDPKMSFGTGHHSTTSLMVQSILETEIKDKDVLDMGCGTSLLAILASMRDAKKVDAIDIDEWPYKNSLENIKNNKADNVSVFLGDARLLEGKKYDVILANINRNILLNDMKSYIACLSQNSQLIMSGFYTEDLKYIQEEAEKNNMKYLGHKVDKNWVAVRFEKK
ncbi:50S ribosomal protein L11 methyltransferase [Ancylomarina sp. 16SWW S1-10-2]|uniref:50S ribosomal protein L11 methyltransferase n=1 Tax=Ancylomarina sp. 16SWW S1-10-2 TaxID=2499681 RepID=UPI0012ADC136|nr:50S ribosomal protein L11 methyltransferase [Ancylomarina sp. 16SWW S1-10-2]MRT92620.1 50S ribosomal protein L11 methyltransferase [Ancylomarina sp. 16SWW S1-10-2]